MNSLSIIPHSEFKRISCESVDKFTKLALIADMCRANALTSVKIAGSGHLGSSFSSLDIVTVLYHSEMNLKDKGAVDQDRDIYFSSKGHDVPGQYAVLHSLGFLDEGDLLKLRRLGGLCGHPDIGTACIEANSGSLGMGISKAKGMALAKKILNRKGRIFVMTGDGELQEGQNYEALQTVFNQNITNIIVIVDHNKVQTDKQVCEISDLGDLELKLKSFGWHVARCDGHDFQQILNSFHELGEINNAPKVLIADTIKGKGISFMEHPADLKKNKGIYRWHSGAPDDADFIRGYAEIISRINGILSSNGLEKLNLKKIFPGKKNTSGVSEEYVADAFGSSLIRHAQKMKNIVVLDADLAGDCRIRNFEKQFPERFIENGIAEQDMVSTAGGLALQGLLPVVNTFGSFLSARANEQIYNNASEKTKIIYVNHYSGLIPAGPGQSHQSIRDISLLSNLPNFEILQPCNATETEMIVDYCLNHTKNNCVIRLVIGPSPQKIQLPTDYELKKGCGVVLKNGNDAFLFSYGPVMLNEALIASQLLKKERIKLGVVNMPWLNRVDTNWLFEIIGKKKPVFFLEDHCNFGGLGDFILHELSVKRGFDNRIIQIFGVEGFPAWGRPPEVLKHHNLDGPSIAERIKIVIKDRNNA